MAGIARIACTCLVVLASSVAVALNVLGLRYDAQTDELVAQIAYRGTNPDHEFSLRWDPCKPYPRSGAPSQVAALVEDSQWDDRALEEFRKTVRFSLEAIPCRPAQVTLHTPAGFVWTVHVPAAPQRKGE